MSQREAGVYLQTGSGSATSKQLSRWKNSMTNDKELSKKIYYVLSQGLTSIMRRTAMKKTGSSARRGYLTVLAGMVVVGCCLVPGRSSADVITWGANSVEMDFVTVGDTNNAADTEGFPTNCGAVAYEYRIGKYEVSGHEYSSMSGLGNEEGKPKAWVTWYDAARFCNWLTTGDTETGLYVFVEGSLDSIRDRVEAVEEYGIVYCLPTEDEWYKAAYYDPDKPGGAGYWDYPDGTNVMYARIPAADDGIAGNAEGVAGGTTVDTDEYPLSASPYGTQQQGGNVFEWNEELIGAARGCRGGSYYSAHSISYAHRDERGSYTPSGSAGSIGFRVVAIGDVFYHTIIATSEEHGNIDPDQGVTVRNGSNVTFTITADEYWHIEDVTTNGASIGAVESFTWSNVTDRGVVYVSIEPDLAAGGTPHWWLADYGWTNNFDDAETGNTDSDPYAAGQEYVLDYDPTVSNEFFRIAAVSNNPPLTLYFDSSTSRQYAVLGCGDLVTGEWSFVTGGIGAGGPDELEITNDASHGYYRLSVEVP